MRGGCHPLATEIEAQSIRWIAELIGFPGDAVCLPPPVGNMANFVCFVAARASMAVLGRQKRRVARAAPVRACSAYASSETHTWIQKAADLFPASGPVRFDCIPTQRSSAYGSGRAPPADRTGSQGEAIHRTGADRARRCSHHERMETSAILFDLPAERDRIHTLTIVGRNQSKRTGPEAVEIRGLLDPGVRLARGVSEQALTAPRQPFFSDVPASHRRAGGDEAHEVCHVAAAHEQAAGVTPEIQSAPRSTGSTALRSRSRAVTAATHPRSD